MTQIHISLYKIICLKQIVKAYRQIVIERNFYLSEIHTNQMMKLDNSTKKKYYSMEKKCKLMANNAQNIILINKCNKKKKIHNNIINI